MVVSLDRTEKATTPSAQTTLSWTHKSLGTDRALTVKIQVVDFHTGDIISVTYDGIPLTVIPGSASSAATYNIELIGYMLVGQPIGTHQIVVTASSPFQMLAISESWNYTNGSIRGSVLTDNQLTASYGGATPGGGAYETVANIGDSFTTFIGYDASTVPTPGAAFGQLLSNHAAISTTYGCASSYAIEPPPPFSLVEYGWSGIGGTAFATFAFVLEEGTQAGLPGGPTRSYPPGLLNTTVP